MSSSEDKCEVSGDKHRGRRKMEYFREVINSTKGRKGKSKQPIEYIKMSRSKMQRDTIFLLRAKLSTLDNLGNLQFFVITLRLN